MSASILSGSQPFSLQSDPGVDWANKPGGFQSDPGVKWDANASTSLAGGRTMGLKRHASADIARNANSLPQSYDAATGGRSTINYDAVYK
jgi:hypothetical protein